MPRKTYQASGRHPQLAMNAAGSRRLATPTKALILTINGGSSGIKFVLFQSDGHKSGESLARLLQGTVDGIGVAKGTFAVKGLERGG
jgi:hypothetical protein